MQCLHKAVYLWPNRTFRMTGIRANLKWLTTYSSVLTFALEYACKSDLERIILLLLLSFPLVGVAEFPFPGQKPLRLLPFLIGMMVLSLYYWKRPRP